MLPCFAGGSYCLSSSYPDSPGLCVCVCVCLHDHMAMLGKDPSGRPRTAKDNSGCPGPRLCTRQPDKEDKLASQPRTGLRESATAPGPCFLLVVASDRDYDYRDCDYRIIIRDHRICDD